MVGFAAADSIIFCGMSSHFSTQHSLYSVNWIVQATVTFVPGAYFQFHRAGVDEEKLIKSAAEDRNLCVICYIN